MALSAVRAAQLGLQTTSNNVANAQTPGYTRQRVALRSSFSRPELGGLVGTGVTVADIGRVRDQMADVRVRNGSSTLAALEVRAELLGFTEVALDEPEGGLSAELSVLWDSFDALSLSPSDPAARSAVLGTLEGTATKFRDLANRFNELEDIAGDTLSSLVSTANDILADVAALNESIVANAGRPSDLMDQRDRLLDELSSMLGTNVIQSDNGGVRVTLNGISLVADTEVLPLSFDANTSAITSQGGIALDPGGEAKGLQQYMLTDIAGFQTALDDMAIDLTTALNATHAGGFSQSGPGGDLLTYDPTDPARTLSVVITDPADLATAGSNGTPFPVNDPTNANALAALRTSLSASGGTESPASAFRQTVTRVAQQSGAIRASAENADRLQTAALDDRESRNGVSLDEEMLYLMEYQRMFEAASRVITAIDQALDVLINRTGLVGR